MVKVRIRIHGGDRVLRCRVIVFDSFAGSLYCRLCWALLGDLTLGGRIKGTLGGLNKVPLKRARSRVQKGY